MTVTVTATPDGMRVLDPVAEPLLDIAGLARRLGVRPRFVRRLVEERRIARLVCFDPVEVERWIRASRVEPSQPWLRLRPRGAS